MVSLFPEKYSQVSRSPEPTGLVRFVKLRRYRRDYWNRVSARTAEGGFHDVRVATMVAESHEIVQQSQQQEFYTHSSEPEATGQLEK